MVKALSLSVCVSAILAASAADARRQLVPDLPSVEVHLEVLQSLAATPPNYAGGGYAAPVTAAPFAHAAPIHTSPNPPRQAPAQQAFAQPVAPQSAPAPAPRQALVQQAQPVLPIPQPAMQAQQPEPTPRQMPVQQPQQMAARNAQTPFTRPIATHSNPAPQTTAAATPAPSAKPSIPVPTQLPTTPIRSVSEGYSSPFATYEPANAPSEDVRELVSKSTKPKAAPKAVAKAQQAPTIPKVEPAPAPKATPKVEPAPIAVPAPAPVAEAPKAVAQVPAPTPVPVAAAPKAVAQVPTPVPALPEPDLDNMVFEEFDAPQEMAAAAPAKPAPLPMPALPAPSAVQPAAISPEPVASAPMAMNDGLPALPDLGALDDEPELNFKQPVLPSGNRALAQPANANLPDLPPMPEPVSQAEQQMAMLDEPSLPEPSFEPTPAPVPTAPSNLPPLTAIIGEPDPSDGIVAESLPELPSELPDLPPMSAPAPTAAATPEPLPEPMFNTPEPEFVLPDPITSEPEFEAPQEMELAALPAPPPSDPAPALPNTPKAGGSTALTISYATDDTRLPDAKKSELEALAKQIINNGQTVRILGYAGGPPEQSSLTRRVSLARVLDVRAHLINYGVPANKVTPQSLGNKGAGSSNPDRVEIVLQ